MKLDFMQSIHNAVFQEISTAENELPLFDIVNVKGITFYNELTKQLKEGKCYEIIEV